MMYYGHNKPGSDPGITPVEAIVLVIVVVALIAPIFLFS